jgi:hypothetical protein
LAVATAAGDVAVRAQPSLIGSFLWATLVGGITLLGLASWARANSIGEAGSSSANQWKAKGASAASHTPTHYATPTTSSATASHTAARSASNSSLKWRPAYVPQLATTSASRELPPQELNPSEVRTVQYSTETPTVAAKQVPTLAPPKPEWSNKTQALPPTKSVPAQSVSNAKVPEAPNKPMVPNAADPNVGGKPGVPDFDKRLFGPGGRSPGEGLDGQPKPKRGSSHDQPRQRKLPAEADLGDLKKLDPKGADAREFHVPTVNCDDEKPTLRGIGALTTRIAPEPGSFPCELSLVGEFEPRCWDDTLYTWKASNLCSKPLYFEQPRAERYGHSLAPGIQPLVSGAHFFTSVVFLPYKMGMQLPGECVYTLGYYRPGGCIPMHVPGIPLSGRGAVMQAGMIGGLFFVH